MSKPVSHSGLPPPKDPNPPVTTGHSNTRKPLATRMATTAPADACAAMAQPGAAEPLHVKQLKEAIVILRRREVEKRTGLGRSSLYARLSPSSPQFDDSFPRPLSLRPLMASPSANGHRKAAVGWIEEEISQWLEMRRAERVS